jgi:hypothetical protein
MNVINQNINGYHQIARIEDLPYGTSKPIEFIYQSTVAYGSSPGYYQWADKPTALTPPRPIQENVLYYFRTLTLTANVSEEDFTAAITTIPQFQMYTSGTQGAPLFREPIYMGCFLQNFVYRLAWMTTRNNESLLAGFQGALQQTVNLIGVNSITLTAIVSAQEITDQNFVLDFRKQYPQ